jgi:hypothetical protein
MTTCRTGNRDDRLWEGLQYMCFPRTRDYYGGQLFCESDVEVFLPTRHQITHDV